VTDFPKRDRPFAGVVPKLMLLLGWGVMAFGVLGLFHSSNRTHPEQWARWFFGSLAAHDFIVAPIVFAAGTLLVTRIPAPWRAPIQGGLIASGIIALTAWPFLRGYGRDPDNPSILPNNYAIGLIVVLAIVWVTVGLISARERRRR
jgi:hypothetical protein